MYFNKNHLLVFPLFLIVTAVIVTSWFSVGKVISNASEENLNIINPTRAAINNSGFWGPLGTGYKSPFLIVRSPYFYILGLIHQAGVEAYLIQAIMLGLIMFLGLVFMYLFLRQIFNFEVIYAISGSLFYLLNLFSMTQIWKRFIYYHHLAWAYLPLFLFSWIKWIDSGKLRYLVIFLVSSLLFCQVFSHPSFVLTFWVTAGLFSIYQAINLKKDRRRVFRLLTQSATAFIFWLIINIWWIYPLTTMSGSYSENNIPQWQFNLDSLKGVSHYQKTQDIIFLSQSWYFGKDSDWFGFYHYPIIYLLSLGVLMVVAYGIYQGRKKKLKYWGFVLSLFIVSWFVSKGTNFPLGDTFYEILFKTIPMSAVLRNPYEKLGIVFLISYTVFLTLGLTWVINKIKPKFKLIVLGSLLFLFCGILVLPIWTGLVFPAKDRVQIPGYYFQANSYLNSVNSQRSFHIPFVTNVEKLSYSWGYIGEDPSENLFDSETVSFPGVPIFENLYQKLPRYLDNRNFPKLLGMLGVDHVILHSDIVSPKTDVASASGMISHWQGIGQPKQIGSIVVYTMDEQLVKPRIYTSSQLVAINSTDELLKAVLNDQINLKTQVAVTGPIMSQNYSLAPKDTFTKLSNTNYKIRIENATGPFVLVFTNTFNPSWQLKVDGVQVKEHFKINGFANGWLVSKNGTYPAEINLKVWPWQ